jgi:hypothetical protein
VILDLLVGQIVQRLQHQHPKHHHDVDRLAAGVALLLAHRRQNRRLDLRPETLERHHASNHLKPIALRGNCREPLVRIEEAELPHHPHIRESCCHKSDSHKFAQVAIFRGALKADLATTAFIYLAVIVLLSLIGSYFVSVGFTILCCCCPGLLLCPARFQFCDRPVARYCAGGRLLTYVIDLTGLVRRARKLTEAALRAEVQCFA